MRYFYVGTGCEFDIIASIYFIPTLIQYKDPNFPQVSHNVEKSQFHLQSFFE